MLGTILSGVIFATAWVMWGQRLSESGAWCLETIGWFHLSSQLRLLLLVSLPVLIFGFVTITWPRLVKPKTIFIQQISPEEFEEQKRRYTRKCLEDLRSSPEYAKHQRAVVSQRIVSSFQDSHSSDYTSFEE